MIYLGNLITTGVKSYYMHQATINALPLFLYVDEFHLFLSPAFDNMLTECAKYNISLTFSHHTHAQINKKTLNIALGNTYTKVVFTCGYEEAERMAKEYRVNIEEFDKLKKYEALVKVGKDISHILTFRRQKSLNIRPIQLTTFYEIPGFSYNTL